MAGWHHWLDGRESEWVRRESEWVSDGQGGLACWDSWGCKESDTTERLNWTELNWWILWVWFQITTIKWIRTQRESHRFFGFPVHIKVRFTLYWNSKMKVENCPLITVSFYRLGDLFYFCLKPLASQYRFINESLFDGTFCQAHCNSHK